MIFEELKKKSKIGKRKKIKKKYEGKNTKSDNL